MPSGATVCAVVVNWNRPGDTVECIRSLSRGGVDGLPVIVVDNGSNDDSVSRITSECPGVELQRVESNLGYTKGANVGLRLALARDPDFVFFINNDAVVGDQCLRELMDALDRHTDSGLAGPKILYYDKDLVWFAGGAFNKYLGYSSHPGMDEPDDGDGKEGQVDYITGCALLVRRELIERIGGFDEDFAMYAEDVEYGMRARANGYRSLYVPTALVRHKVSSSAGVPGSNTMTPRRSFAYARNMLILALKCIPWPRKFTCFLGQFLVALPYHSYLICSQNVKGSLTAYYRGILSGLRWAVNRQPASSSLGLAVEPHPEAAKGR